MQFQKAERRKAKLRLALSGTSGSGKTMGALRIAKGMGGKTAVVDSERKSASLYSDVLNFDVLELGPPYSPEKYIEAINAAEKAGYDVLILDSITHEWSGDGGILDINSSIARAKYRGNTFAAWEESTPRHQRFVDAMLSSSMHIIATMRSKAVYVETEKANGKKAIEKQGTAPQQRDGMEYEFTAMLEITKDGHFALSDNGKDRTRLFTDPIVITEETGKRLLEWLELGAEPPATLDMAAVSFEIATANTIETLKAVFEGYKEQAVSAGQLPELNAITRKRKEELEVMAAKNQAATAKLTDGQRKTIMAHYNGKTREERLKDMGQFLSREITTFSDLLKSEAESFINAIEADKYAQEAAHA